MRKKGGLVYSTGKGRMCPTCGWPADDCKCSSNLKQVAPSGPVLVRRETKGRKGKGVTIVTGVPLTGDELKALGKELKKRCGSGGTVKDGTIEIQGEHRDLLVEELRKRGWTVKKSGG